VTRNGAQSELADLFGTRTELQCIVDDLRSAGAVIGGKRAQLEAELNSLVRDIDTKEGELKTTVPEWEAQRAKENVEKRKLEEADTKLKALFSKQGRLTHFRSKAERDQYLRQEIASIKAYQATQASALEATRVDLETSQNSLKELDKKIVGVRERIEDGRKRVEDLRDQALVLKDQHTTLIEKRKELWREDTKYDTLVKQASEHLKKAEVNLASLMDKVHLSRYSCCIHLMKGFTGYRPRSSIYRQNRRKTWS
jgi:structural maintenance of chromosome 3 (chondroitin sulfate proteoglycan 6)